MVFFNKNVCVGLAALISICLIHQDAYASSSNGVGQVQNVRSLASGAVDFDLDQTFFDPATQTRQAKSSRSALPACASGDTKHWAIDASTDQGRTMMTTLLWAVDHGRYVSVIGTGSCSIIGDTETVASITIA